ncbi:hypothetical protein V6N13_135351 [Hibiscus sabdariffa]
MQFPTPLSVLCCHSNSIKFDLPVAISTWQIAGVQNSTPIKFKNLSFQDLISTTKLILRDGRLQEFHYPVKVSYVLQMNPMCFLCNADEMDSTTPSPPLKKIRSFDSVNSTLPCL